MDRVFERAALCGLETEYRDAFGNLRTVEPEVLTRILKALAEELSDEPTPPHGTTFNAETAELAEQKRVFYAGSASSALIVVARALAYGSRVKSSGLNATLESQCGTRDPSLAQHV